MAIYHYDADIASRKAGQSSIAMSAYRCGESLVDIRTGEVKDFSRKAGVIHAEIAAPEGSPEWVFDRQELWNRVEQSEKRVDAQLCRSMIGALPHELSDEERLGLVRDFVTREFTSKGMVVDFQIHAPGKGGDDKNFHVHMMGTTRRLDETTATGFAGKKEAAWRPDFKKGKGFKTALAGGEFLSGERDAWAEACNRAMEAAQIEARISAASLERRGVEREARTHLGPSATAMERRGIKTRLGDRNRAIDAEDGRVQEERRQLEAKAAAAEREAALKSTALDGAERQIHLLVRHLENLEASAKAAREQEATARELAEARRANEPKPAPVISSPEALRAKQAEQERKIWEEKTEVSRKFYPFISSQRQTEWRDNVSENAPEPYKTRIEHSIREWEAKDDLARLEHAAAQNAAMGESKRKHLASKWPDVLARLEAQAREAEALREKHQAEDIPAAIQKEREERRQAGWLKGLEREGERKQQAEQKQEEKAKPEWKQKQEAEREQAPAKKSTLYKGSTYKPGDIAKDRQQQPKQEQKPEPEWKRDRAESRGQDRGQEVLPQKSQDRAQDREEVREQSKGKGQSQSGMTGMKPAYEQPKSADELEQDARKLKTEGLSRSGREMGGKLHSEHEAEKPQQTPQEQADQLLAEGEQLKQELETLEQQEKALNGLHPDYDRGSIEQIEASLQHQIKEQARTILEYKEELIRQRNPEYKPKEGDISIETLGWQQDQARRELNYLGPRLKSAAEASQNLSEGDKKIPIEELKDKVKDKIRDVANKSIEHGKKVREKTKNGVVKGEAATPLEKGLADKLKADVRAALKRPGTPAQKASALKHLTRGLNGEVRKALAEELKKDLPQKLQETLKQGLGQKKGLGEGK